MSQNVKTSGRDKHSEIQLEKQTEESNSTALYLQNKQYVL